MIKQIIDKNLCTGCGACVSSCPCNAITMKCDVEGFQYPVIDNEKCIDCDFCTDICKSRRVYKPNTKATFIVESKDEAMRMGSSSGGAFGELAQFIIKQGGVVIGAAFDDELQVKHVAVENMNHLHRLRGSKYVQSSAEQVYPRVEELLKDNRTVLFSGTPCQVAGLRAFLRMDYDNLFLVDIICQGVPGANIWKQYLELKQSESKIMHVNFRDKSEGWNQLNISYEYENGKRTIVSFDDDCYMRGFEETEILRPSCYNCSFRGLNNCSDITLGDCWSYEKLVGKLSDEKGASVCLINSEKGKEMFDKISPSLKIIKSLDAKELRPYNKNLFVNPLYSGKRQEFLNLFSVQEYEKAFSLLMKQDRNKKYVEVLYSWLGKEIKDSQYISDKIISLGYRNIAIYGMGILGNYLWEKLHSCSEITVVYCIDSERKENSPIPIVESKKLNEEMLKGIDVIIVTPIHIKYGIINSLSQYYKGDIISLEDIFR